MADLAVLIMGIKEADSDFERHDFGNTVKLTEAMAKEFVERYTRLCIEEISCFRKGREFLKIEDYKWEINR